MLRSFIIYLSKAAWAQRLITSWGFARRAARRFVAGETPDEAIEVLKELTRRGILGTLDHLGENTVTAEDAHQATDEIIMMLDRIQQVGARSGISVKLSQIGLLIDAGLCRDNLIRILEHAGRCQNFVRVDMEDSSLTTKTLDTYRSARVAGYDNLGVVIQSYLFRSESDVREMIEVDCPIRLCKGAYKEPATIAFPKKADVDANYDRLTQILLDYARLAGPDVLARSQMGDGRYPPVPAFATHDPKRIEFAKSYAAKNSIPSNRFEFQMLYGIRRDLQENLKAGGYSVRVYVPYGTHWYPYFMRRLAERPANVWFFVSNYFRK